jgi:hypothetical protein
MTETETENENEIGIGTAIEIGREIEIEIHVVAETTPGTLKGITESLATKALMTGARQLNPAEDVHEVAPAAEAAGETEVEIGKETMRK